jgi:hypothetical protein
MFFFLRNQLLSADEHFVLTFSGVVLEKPPAKVFQLEALGTIKLREHAAPFNDIGKEKGDEVSND